MEPESQPKKRSAMGRRDYQLALSLGGVTGANILVTFGIHAYVLIAVSPGVETDALFAAAAVPQFFLMAITGSLVQVVVPILAAKRDAQFKNVAWSLFISIGVAFAAVAILLDCSSGFWIPLLFPGLSDAGRLLATDLNRIHLIGMVIAALIVVLKAVHYARQRFFWVESSHLIESVIGFVILAWTLPIYGIKAAAWLFVLRAVVQALLLLPGFGTYAKPTFRSVDMVETWQRLRPLLMAMIYYKSSPLVDRFLSSMVPAGGLSLFFFGYQIYAALNELINKAVTVPMIPVLARTAAASNWSSYRKLYQERLRWVISVTVIGYVLLVLIGQGTLTLLIGYGGITADAIRRLWWILLAMGGLLIAGGVGQILAAAFHAKGDTRTPAAIGVLGFTVGNVLKLSGFLKLGLLGVAIGVSLHQLLNSLLLYMVLEKKLKSLRLVGRPPTLLNGTDKWLLRNVPRSVVPCPLCAGVRFRRLVSNDRYDMGIQTGRCCQCGLVMTNPVPNEETMRDFYKHHYRRYYRKAEIPTLQYIEEFGLAQRAKYTISYLQGKNLLLKNARILDVGCSEGSLLKEIQRREPGVELVGIEPNESFANFARDFLNSKVYSSLAELSLKGESGFSLVIVNHVLEHVEDPVGFLKQLSRVLADNGCIYADVPDLSGYASLADFHIAHRYHFSIRTLSATAHKAQLRVAEMERHTPPYHPRSIRCLLKLQCEEPILLRSELDDGPAYRRLKAINRWRWCYYIRQQVPTLGFRTARKAFRALAE